MACAHNGFNVIINNFVITTCLFIFFKKHLIFIYLILLIGKRCYLILHLIVFSIFPQPVHDSFFAIYLDKTTFFIKSQKFHITTFFVQPASIILQYSFGLDDLKYCYFLFIPYFYDHFEQTLIMFVYIRVVYLRTGREKTQNGGWGESLIYIAIPTRGNINLTHVASLSERRGLRNSFIRFIWSTSYLLGSSQQ